MSVRIRAATNDDARAIAALQVEGWRWGYRGILPERHLASLDVDARADRWAEILGSARPPEQTFVAVDASHGEGSVGFVSIGAAREAPAGAGEIYALYVAERVAGRGVGHALVVRALEALAAFDPVILWVLEANPRARRFYERQGFRADGGSKEETIGGATVRELRYATTRRRGARPRLVQGSRA